MQEQNFVLITRPDKIPVKKLPMFTTTYFVLKLLYECRQRTEAEQEIRTVCIIDEYGEFDAYAEADFRARFQDTTEIRPDALMPHYPCR